MFPPSDPVELPTPGLLAYLVKTEMVFLGIVLRRPLLAVGI